MPRTAPFFGDQFLLSRGERPHPADFVTRSQGGWVLAAGASLPVTVLRSADRPVGWILGWPVTAGGALVREAEPPTSASGGLEVPALGSAEFEEFLYGFAGRWAAIVTEGTPRLYLDPGGSLAAVYDPREEVAGSTTTLIRWGDPFTFSAERYGARVLKPNEYFPSGLTSDAGAWRLLPNHYLSLTSWSATRHWAPEPGYIGAADIPAAVSGIFDAVAGVIRALSESRRLLLPLTAGRDSRMVMAAAHSVVDRCDFVTFRYRDYRRTDATFGTAIAERFDLPHTVLSVPEAPEEEKKAYLEAVGYDGHEGKARDFHLAARRLALDRGFLTGFAGEIGRGDHLHATARLTPKKLLRRQGFAVTARNVDAYSRWLEGIPTKHGERILDIHYIEQGVGAWGGAHCYGTAPFAFNVMPMNQRRVLEAMIRLPPDYRRARRLVTDMVRLGWPELEGLPFGRPPGLVGQAEGVARVARKLREGHVVRKVWTAARR